MLLETTSHKQKEASNPPEHHTGNVASPQVAWTILCPSCMQSCRALLQQTSFLFPFSNSMHYLRVFLFLFLYYTQRFTKGKFLPHTLHRKAVTWLPVQGQSHNWAGQRSPLFWKQWWLTCEFRKTECQILPLVVTRLDCKPDVDSRF